MPREIAEYIRDELLKRLAKPVEELSPEEVWSFRNKLHALHHYALRAGLPEETISQIESMLETSSSLWGLLYENRDVMTAIKDYHRVRKLDASSGIVSEMEEIISGEETVRDVLVEAIAIYLTWRSDTIWIDEGWRDHRAVVHTYLFELQDHIWEFLKSGGSDGKAALEDSERIGKLMEGMRELILSEEIPSPQKVEILARIYHLLLRLQLGRLLLLLDRS